MIGLDAGQDKPPYSHSVSPNLTAIGRLHQARPMAAVVLGSVNSMVIAHWDQGRFYSCAAPFDIACALDSRAQ